MFTFLLMLILILVLAKLFGPITWGCMLVFLPLILIICVVALLI